MSKAPALALVLAISSAAHAQVTIYAVNNIRGPGETSDRLVSFQSNNPAGWTSIGLTGANNVQFSGLEFAGIGGGLYAWGSLPTSGMSDSSPLIPRRARPRFSSRERR